MCVRRGDDGEAIKVSSDLCKLVDKKDVIFMYGDDGDDDVDTCQLFIGSADSFHFYPLLLLLSGRSVPLGPRYPWSELC